MAPIKQPFVSVFEYESIMKQSEYDYETREWVLPSKCIHEFEVDQDLRFSTRYAMHEFVYAYLATR